jgi:uncharacterized repeat protein (TIGR02543 family)
MKKRFKKLVSTLLAVTLIAGTAVMTPIADVVGTRIVAEATSESSGYICHYCIGKYLNAGTQIFPNAKVYRTTIYLDNSMVLNQSADTYTLPNRVYVNDNTTQNDNVYVLYFTTAKLNQSPTISVESKTYDGSAVSYDAGTGYGTCTVNFTGINGTSYDSTTAPSTAGDYRMTVSYEGDGNYNSWSGTADFTISRATPNYTVPSNLTALCGQTLADVTLPTGWEWVNPSTSLSSAGENTFKATYTPTDTTNYNVVDNVDVTVNVSIPAYTVTWKNADGTVIDTTTVAYGDTPTHADVTKENTAQYTYTFKGWTSDNGTTVYTAEALPVATEDVTYTAQFTKTTNTYTVIWKNEDGTTLETDTVAYGTTPKYNGTKPAKDSTAEYRYILSWTDGTNTYLDSAVPEVTGDVTYTVTFTAEKHYIDTTHHAWYTFDITTGHMEIYGDGQSFTFGKEIYTNFDGANGSKTDIRNLIKSVHFNSGIVPTAMNKWLYNCRYLTTVTGTIPNAQTANAMFLECQRLESVPNMPSITGNKAINMFKNCYALTTIGNGVFTIHANQIEDMFYNCHNLSAHITFDTRPTTTNPESHVANLFTGAATADGTEITVCFSGLAKRDGFDSLVIPQIESASGNVKQHDFPEFTDDSNGTTHSRVCSQCGKTETESHTFDNGICTVCGAKEIYTITVTNGTITTGEKESYNVGDIVTLKADAPEEGKVFAYWEDGNGNKLSTKANYSFVVLKSVDLTAVYNNDYVAEAILDISAVQTSSNGKNAIRFVFNRSVDTKAEVEEVGLIYATNKLAGYTRGAKVNLTELEGFDIETVLKENTSGTVKTYKSTSTSINGTIRFTYTIGNNTDCYVYAYGYVKLSDGTTLYTDLIATTYNSIG